MVLEPAVDTRTETGQAMVAMAGAVAAADSAAKSRNMKLTARRRRAAGLRVGRERLHGETIEARVRSLHRRGDGPTEIARKLNRDGLRNAAGNPWQHGSITKLLSRSGT